MHQRWPAVRHGVISSSSVRHLGLAENGRLYRFCQCVVAFLFAVIGATGGAMALAAPGLQFRCRGPVRRLCARVASVWPVIVRTAVGENTQGKKPRWTYGRFGHEVHGVTFQDKWGPDEDGWMHVDMHPKSLHIGRSACRLGKAIDWGEVRRLAHAVEGCLAERAGGTAFEADGHESTTSCVETDFSESVTVPLRASATFETLEGHGSPFRMLTDTESLHAAYAAAMTDTMIHVRYRELQISAEDDAEYPDAADNYFYCPRWRDAARAESGPTAVMLSRRPMPNNAKRELALIDPLAVTPRLGERKLKPAWPKTWVYARRMAGGEEFPPVRINWDAEMQVWEFKDGCHRYFASLISGKYLPVAYCVPRASAAGAERPPRPRRKSRQRR